METGCYAQVKGEVSWTRPPAATRRVVRMHPQDRAVRNDRYAQGKIRPQRVPARLDQLLTW